MSLGQKLKELRRKQNLSRENLANEMGLSYWTLSKYETDEREPDYQTLIQFADYFQVSIDYLLERGHGLETSYMVDLSAFPGVVREEIVNYIEYQRAKIKKNKK